MSVFAEGFQSWMWRGLTFLLPFLFFGHVSQTSHILVRNLLLYGMTHFAFGNLVCYEAGFEMQSSNEVCLGHFHCASRYKRRHFFCLQFWQLYNSVTLFRLARHADCREWQVRLRLMDAVIQRREMGITTVC